MSHHKRKKSSRKVGCTLCTPYLWMGNTTERRPVRDRNRMLLRNPDM